MIIDSHVHLGTMLGFDLTEQDIIASLEKYGIGKALVSNLESTEFGHKQEPLPEEIVVSELESNRRTLELVRRHPGVLFGQYWFKPATERLTTEAEALIRDNRDAFRGLKIHPYHSMTSIADPKCEPWLALAAELKLPVAVHTAGDRFSDSVNVYTAAKAHPDVDFIMVHLGLGTDNRKAIELVSSLRTFSATPPGFRKNTRLTPSARAERIKSFLERTTRSTGWTPTRSTPDFSISSRRS